MVLPSQLARVATVVVLAALALTACSPRNAAPTLEQPQTQAPTILEPKLAPGALVPLSPETAQAEATRLGDEIAKLIAPELVTSVSDQSQLVLADDDIAAYYVMYRIYQLDASVDVATLAETIAAVIAQSGWVEQGKTTEDGVTIIALAGGTEEQPWFMFVQGQVGAEGPALSISLGGPDL